MDAPETLYGLLDKCVNLLSLPNVACLAKNPDLQLPDDARHLLGLGPGLLAGVQEAERHIGACPGEVHGDGPADSARSATDDGHLAPEALEVAKRSGLGLDPHLVEKLLHNVLHSRGLRRADPLLLGRLVTQG